MMTLEKNAKLLASVATRCANAGPAGGKEEFHSVGRKVLKDVLKALGGDGDIRSCKGGPGVVGEVILHTDHVYVQLCTPSFGGPVQFLYRSCKGRKDYLGGCNLWFSFSRLAEDPTAFIARLKDLTEHVKIEKTSCV